MIDLNETDYDYEIVAVFDYEDEERTVPSSYVRKMRNGRFEAVTFWLKGIPAEFIVGDYDSRGMAVTALLEVFYALENRTTGTTH